MIDPLIRLHFHQSFWLNSNITPANIPIFIVINVCFAWKFHIKHIFGNPSYNFVLCIQNIHNQSSRLWFSLLNFSFLRKVLHNFLHWRFFNLKVLFRTLFKVPWNQLCQVWLWFRAFLANSIWLFFFFCVWLLEDLLMKSLNSSS